MIRRMRLADAVATGRGSAADIGAMRVGEGELSETTEAKTKANAKSKCRSFTSLRSAR